MLMGLFDFVSDAAGAIFGGGSSSSSSGGGGGSSTVSNIISNYGPDLAGAYVDTIFDKSANKEDREDWQRFTQYWNDESQKWAKYTYKQNMDNFIQRRVADAKKAGIHPLYSLGAGPGSAPTFMAGTPSSGSVARSGVGNALSRAHQRALTRAVNASAARDEAQAIKTNSEVATGTQQITPGQAAVVVDNMVRPMPAPIISAQSGTAKSVTAGRKPASSEYAVGYSPITGRPSSLRGAYSEEGISESDLWTQIQYAVGNATGYWIPGSAAHDIIASIAKSGWHSAKGPRKLRKKGKRSRINARRGRR